MKNVIYTILAFGAIGLTIYFTFFQKEDPTLDTLRVQTAEARSREKQATKDREAGEDAESKAMYLECFHKTTTQTGIRFNAQQKNAYECWQDQLTKINTGSTDAPQASVPPKSLTSLYVSSKSTLRGDNLSDQTGGSKIQPTLKTPGKSVANTLPNGGPISGSPDKNGSGKKDQQGGIQKVCPTKTILRKGWNDPRVQFAYNLSCGDMDFIKTIEAESKWDINALGDQGHSFGLCQINKLYNPEMQRLYRNLKSDNEKVSFCYAQYSEWKKRGVLKTRLYGFNVRNKPQNNSFTFK